MSNFVTSNILQHAQTLTGNGISSGSATMAEKPSHKLRPESGNKKLTSFLMHAQASNPTGNQLYSATGSKTMHGKHVGLTGSVSQSGSINH